MFDIIDAALCPSFKFRFTFIMKGSTYFEGISYQISDKFYDKWSAFRVALECFIREHETHSTYRKICQKFDTISPQNT